MTICLIINVNTNMNNQEIVVLIDLDDTIIDLITPWINSLNQKHGLNVSISDIDNWDICKFFPTLSRYEVFEPIFEKGFWDNVKPKGDAVEYVRKLYDDGYRIYICTNSNYKTLPEKLDKVLFKYFDFLSWNDVIVTSNKQLVNADFLVDDAIHNLINGRYKGILMEAQHNKNFNIQGYGITRAKNWREIYTYISKATKHTEDN